MTKSLHSRVGSYCVNVMLFAELNWFSVTLEGIGKGLGRDGYGASHEFGDIVAPHELAMIVRISTRQFERLGALSVLIDMSDERTCILPVVASAAENNPSSIA